MNRCRTGLAVGLMLCLPTLASAQITISGRGATIQIGGLLQGQYFVSSIDAADSDFSVQRARLLTDLEVTDFLTGRVVTEFGGGSGRLLDADMTLHVSDALAVSAGQFKRAFDIFELPDPADLPLIDRDGRVSGFSSCSGVGSVCSYSRFTEALGFAGRDLGVRVMGSSGSVSYSGTLTNGSGINTRDENDRKSLSGRVTLAVSDDVRLSGQLALHDYVDADGNATAVAFGGDVELGTWRDGLHVRGAVIAGENWLNLDGSLDPSTFLTLQGVASYYYPMDADRLAGIEPLARISYGDPDTGTSDDGGVLVTPGVMVYLFGRSRIGANLDVYTPQGGDKEFSLKVQTTLYF